MQIQSTIFDFAEGEPSIPDLEKEHSIHASKTEGRKIGKKVGHHYYIHRSAVHTLPPEIQELIEQAKQHVLIPYEVIKVNMKDYAVSFIDSPDWNEAHEPIVGDSIKVSKDGKVTFKKGRSNNPQIYHHKWLFVEDTYIGFEVEESKKRSALWENSGLPFDRKKIGNRDYWHQVLKGLPTEQEINEIRVDKTCIKQVPALFKNSKIVLGPINLDLGGGKYDVGTEFLREKGATNLIFDPYSRTYEFNQKTLQKLKYRPADTISVCNVLNVIQKREEREGVIAQAAYLVNPEGVVYFQIYEGNRSGVGSLTKIQTWQENRKTADYIEEIQPYFQSVRKISNIIECRYPIKVLPYHPQLRKQNRQWALKNGVFVVEGTHELPTY